LSGPDFAALKGKPVYGTPGDVLTVQGEKKSEREEKKEDYHLVERSYGTLSHPWSCWLR